MGRPKGSKNKPKYDDKVKLPIEEVNNLRTENLTLKNENTVLKEKISSLEVEIEALKRKCNKLGKIVGETDSGLNK